MGARCDSNDRGLGVTLIKSTDVDGILAISVAGITATITITIPGGGYHLYDLWLSDSATDPTETSNVPTSGIHRFRGNTDTDGEATISFENNAASRTWYLWGTFNKLNVSSAIAVGT